MNIFFTADTHYGHNAVIQFCRRPYNDVKEMDADLIKRWNDRVTNRDTVFHLGDFTFYGNAKAAEIYGELNGKKILIRGNHDRGMAKWWFDLWDEVHYYYELKDNRERFYLTHFPFEEWDYGYHLHGHTHNNLSREVWNKHYRLDVGVDVHNFAPIELTEVRQILGKLI
jgi:calcineurin-like phosphoesterase family protein